VYVCRCGCDWMLISVCVRWLKVGFAFTLLNGHERMCMKTSVFLCKWVCLCVCECVCVCDFH